MTKLKQFILLYGTAVFLVVLTADLGIAKQTNVWWKYLDALILAGFVFFFVKPMGAKPRNSTAQ